MTTVELEVTSDGYVIESVPTYNSGASKSLTVAQGSGTDRFSYLYFNRPFPLRVNVVYATLRLHQKGVASGGTRTLTARRTAEKWSESTLQFSGRPPVTGSSASSAPQGNGGSDGRVWEIDITAIMQLVADGAPWYGLRIESDVETMLTLFSSEADEWNPEIEIEFSDAPEVPTILSPSNGRAVSIARPPLRMDFTDHAGDTSLQYVRVVMNEGGPSDTPTVDTGDVPAEVPEWTPDFDIGVGEDWWWAGEVVDGVGLRSGLSEWVNFTRTAKPTVAIVSPVGSVTEPTPPLIATVTGGTQDAYQWFITAPDDVSEVLWDSKKVSSPDLGISVPLLNPPVLTPGGEYGLLRRTWDDVAREQVPGDPVYVDTFTTFTYDLVSGVAPVTALTATPISGTPDVLLEWTSATTPDSYTIILDGVATEINIDPADTITAGTANSWLLRGTRPRRAHNVSVLRVVNGETSDDNGIEPFTTNPEGVWLSTRDGLHAVGLSNRPGETASAGFAPTELIGIYDPLGAANSVLISQGVLGRKGHISACIEGIDGLSLDEQLAEWDAINDLRKYPRPTVMQLVLTDTSIRCVPYNVVTGEAHEFDDWVPVDFDYFEVR